MPADLFPLPIFFQPDIGKPTFSRLAGLDFLPVMLGYKQFVAPGNDQVLLDLHLFMTRLKEL